MRGFGNEIYYGDATRLDLLQAANVAKARALGLTIDDVETSLKVASVVREYKAGKVEFRNDSGGNVHAVVGKLSFDNQRLQENIQSFMDHIEGLKPAVLRGTYVRNISLSATMSPGVPVAA